MNIKKLVAFLLLTGIAASLSAQNMNRYITVKLSSKGKNLWLFCDASEENPAMIVSGTNYKIVKTSVYEYFTANSDTLYVFGNVTRFNCSKNSCIEAIDLTHNMQLRELICSETSLRILNIEWKDTALKILDCSKTPISRNFLPIGYMVGLEYLFLDSMGNMDNPPPLDKITKLKYLSCSGNNWRSIDVSHMTLLEKLNCSNNELRSLDISKNTRLMELNCSRNYFMDSSLDVSNNTKLTNLDCSYNSLVLLRVRNNPELTSLVCCNNWLFSLDVSGKTKLVNLNCSANFLNFVKLYNNTKLEHLNCSKNRITSLCVDCCPELKSLYCYRNDLSYKELDLIMCSLPVRKSFEKARFCPVYRGKSTAYQDSVDMDAFMKCNSSNAKANGWLVQYGDDSGDIPATNGKFDCDSGGFQDPVREAAAESAMRVWPNPARTELHIASAAGEVCVHDLTGRVVYRAESGNDDIVVNIADWAKGMYFVRSGRHTLKFIKE